MRNFCNREALFCNKSHKVGLMSKDSRNFSNMKYNARYTLCSVCDKNYVFEHNSTHSLFLCDKRSRLCIYRERERERERDDKEMGRGSFSGKLYSKIHREENFCGFPI